MKFCDVVIKEAPVTVIFRHTYRLRAGLRVLFRYCGSRNFLSGIITKLENQRAFIQLI